MRSSGLNTAMILKLLVLYFEYFKGTMNYPLKGNIYRYAHWILEVALMSLHALGTCYLHNFFGYIFSHFKDMTQISKGILIL